MIPPPLPQPPPRAWGSPIERERRNRILVAVCAYAYELRDHSLVPDAAYDALARSIQPQLRTNHDALDHFFTTRYSADTGQWIHEHPELDGIRRLYETHYVR